MPWPERTSGFRLPVVTDECAAPDALVDAVEQGRASRVAADLAGHYCVCDIP
jgi:hypothetical protein